MLEVLLHCQLFNCLLTHRTTKHLCVKYFSYNNHAFLCVPGKKGGQVPPQPPPPPGYAPDIPCLSINAKCHVHVHVLNVCMYMYMHMLVHNR